MRERPAAPLATPNGAAAETLRGLVPPQAADAFTALLDALKPLDLRLARGAQPFGPFDPLLPQARLLVRARCRNARLQSGR